MNKNVLAVSVAAMLLLGTVASLAAEPPPPPMGNDMEGMQHGGGPGGKHGGPGGGMGGMHEKREGMMSQHLMIPRFPPGNDKLQLMMRAEIMQKVGEIVTKYASQLPDKK